MNAYQLTVPVYDKALRNLDGWIEKAIAFAAQKKFDPDTLVQARLAPDQFPLGRQIQAACDTAKYAVAKLSAKEPPSHPDTEKTIAEFRARIATVREHLATFQPRDFDGWEERRCSHGFMRGKSLRGTDYIPHYAIPNFFFHLTTAYAILRHNGVDIGKADYLGEVPLEG